MCLCVWCLFWENWVISWDPRTRPYAGPGIKDWKSIWDSYDFNNWKFLQTKFLCFSVHVVDKMACHNSWIHLPSSPYEAFLNAESPEEYLMGLIWSRCLNILPINLGLECGTLKHKHRPLVHLLGLNWAGLTEVSAGNRIPHFRITWEKCTKRR